MDPYLYIYIYMDIVLLFCVLFDGCQKQTIYRYIHISMRIRFMNGRRQNVATRNGMPRQWHPSVRLFQPGSIRTARQTDKAWLIRRGSGRNTSGTSVHGHNTPSGTRVWVRGHESNDSVKRSTACQCLAGACRLRDGKRELHA